MNGAWNSVYNFFVKLIHSPGAFLEHRKRDNGLVKITGVTYSYSCTKAGKKRKGDLPDASRSHPIAKAPETHR
jgi:hypothetical protein